MINTNENKGRLLIIAAVILITVAVGVGVWYSVDRYDVNETAAERAARIPIAEFSLGGVISSISGNTFVMETGWIEETELGKRFVKHSKTIVINQDTRMTIKDDTGKKALLRGGNELREGDRAIVFGGQYPYNQELFNATRVEIIRQ